MRISFLILVLISVLALEHAFTAPELKIVDSVQEGDMIRYAYVGEEVPELLEEGEIKERRTETSYTIYVGTGEEGRDAYRTRTYSTPTFVRDGRAWHVVEHGRDSQEGFLARTKPSTLSRIARVLVAPTYAVQVFSHSGDGSIEGAGATWANARSATPTESFVADDSWCLVTTCLPVANFDEDGWKGIVRAYVPFDTSSIPSGATITAASLNLYVATKLNEDNDGNDFATVVQTSQADYTSLTEADYGDIGSTEGIDNGQRKDISSVSTSAYLSFTLNSTGMGWIAKSGDASNCHASATGITCLGIRLGHDLNNQDMIGDTGNHLDIYSSSRAGTSQDPYLDITYTEAEEGSGMTALSRPPNNLGLVGYWSFDDGRGTVATDFSGKGNNGTLNGGTWTSGKRHQALSVDGNDDYVDMGTPTNLGLTGDSAFTISAWINPGATRNDGSYFSYGGADSGRVISLNSDSSGNIYSVHYNNDHSFTRDFELGRWQHVVLTYDGTTERLYYDGDYTGESWNPSDLGLISGDAMRIGRASWNGIYAHTSAIDEVRVYNRALSASEVAALARAGAARVGASSADLTRGSSLEQGLVGHWTFDGKDTNWTSATAGTVADTSGNSNTGSLTNMSRGFSTESGVLGQGMRFDGSNDYIDAGNGASLGLTSSMSAAAWVYVDSFGPGAEDDIIISKFDLSDRGWVMGFSFDDPDRGLAFSVSDNSQNQAGRLSAAAFQTGQWYHVVGVYDASVPVINTYVNGTLSNGVTFGSLTTSQRNSGADVFIGRNPDGSIDDPFSGALDDIRIYNRALTAAEVKQLYNLGQVKIRQ